MDRKKFVGIISTGFAAAYLLKASLFRHVLPKNKSEKNYSVKVKINPNAVVREKSGKKNG